MQKDIKYWYLRNHQLFSHMTSEEINELCIISKYKLAKKNEDIYFSNEEDKKVYILKKGSIKIMSLDADGNEVTKDVIQTGDIFGEITLEDTENTIHNEFARAISKDVSICSFRVDDFEKILQSKPHLAIKYTKLVGFKLRSIENRYSNLMFKDVKTRLIFFLKEFALQNGNKNANSLTTNHFFTQQDIANLIGASRQTVTTLMNEFTEKKLLEYSRSSYTITSLSEFV